MACSSVEAAVADGRVAQLLGRGGPASVLEAASEEGALGTGTAVAVAAWGDGSHRVDVAFEGTRGEAEAWIATLSGVMFASTGSWSIVRDGGVVDVVLASGSLSFAERGSMASQRRGAGPHASSLSGAAGCEAVDPVLTVPAIVRSTAPAGDLGPAGRARVGSLRAPIALSEGGAEPFTASSTVAPDLVLTLGVPWHDIAADLWPEGGPLWSHIPQGLASPAGTTVAVYGHGRVAGLAVAVPIENRRGEPMPASRATRVLRNLAQSGLVTADGDGLFLVEGAKRATWVAPVDGGVVIGNRRDVLVDALAGAGRPWVDAQLTALASTTPVAAAVRRDEATVLVAAHAREGGWDLEVDQPGATRQTVERLTELLMVNAGRALAVHP